MAKNKKQAQALAIKLSREQKSSSATEKPTYRGGPLLDSAGRLIGVNTTIFSRSGTNAGIGFAIPVDVVNRIGPELIRNGRVPTPGIGIVAANEDIGTGSGSRVVAQTAPGRPRSAPAF